MADGSLRWFLDNMDNSVHGCWRRLALFQDVLDRALPVAAEDIVALAHTGMTDFFGHLRRPWVALSGMVATGPGCGAVSGPEHGILATVASISPGAAAILVTQSGPRRQLFTAAELEDALLVLVGGMRRQQCAIKRGAANAIAIRLGLDHTIRPELARAVAWTVSTYALRLLSPGALPPLPNHAAFAIDGVVTKVQLAVMYEVDNRYPYRYHIPLLRRYLSVPCTATDVRRVVHTEEVMARGGCANRIRVRTTLIWWWSQPTHHLHWAKTKRLVWYILCIAGRLQRTVSPLTLPPEMWMLVLTMVDISSIPTRLR